MITVYTRDAEFYQMIGVNVNHVIKRCMVNNNEITQKNLSDSICKEYFHTILEYFDLNTIEYWDIWVESFGEYSIDSTFDGVATNEELIEWCIEMCKED